MPSHRRLSGILRDLDIQSVLRIRTCPSVTPSPKGRHGAACNYIAFTLSSPLLELAWRRKKHPNTVNWFKKDGVNVEGKAKKYHEVCWHERQETFAKDVRTQKE